MINKIGGRVFPVFLLAVGLHMIYVLTVQSQAINNRWSAEYEYKLQSFDYLPEVPMDYTCHDIAQMIDHSLLRPELTEEDVRKGCEIAKKYKAATVCCRPSEVVLVKQLLQDSDVKTTTVVGFPHGYNRTETKAFEAKQAIEDGAVELDMVINIGKLLDGDYGYVKNDIQAVVEVAHSNNVAVKVIFENFYLNDEQKKVACRLAEEA